MNRNTDSKKQLPFDKRKENLFDVSSCRESVETHLCMRDEKCVGTFMGLTMTSAFQPIFSLAHRRPVGHEALLRARSANGDSISPLDVFGMAGTEAETTLLDRLRRALHVRTYLDQRLDNSWLFLNVNPAVVMHGKDYGIFFSDLLERYGFPAHRVVVKILEDSTHDESKLSPAVGYYRDLGCLVAIDDFGSGYSNFERIWGLAPDIVKLDRSILTQAAPKKKVRRVLPSLVSLLHEAGCLVVMEGIESEDEALIAMDADVDFVQGYYFGRPAETLKIESVETCTLMRLCEQFKNASAEESKAQEARIAAHISEFRTCVAALQADVPFESACTEFVRRAGVARCYLLDPNARQIGRKLTSSAHTAKVDPRFLPLEDVSGAHWFRRPYFRRAIGQPGVVHMSRPYLSLTGMHICVTLAIAIEYGSGNRVVLCCDLDCE